jgi:hypothetical protein
MCLCTNKRVEGIRQRRRKGWLCIHACTHTHTHTHTHDTRTFQHRQASLRCCKMVLALFCFTPCGIMSRMSCMTAARSSRSKWLSIRCLVTVLAIPCGTAGRRPRGNRSSHKCRWTRLTYKVRAPQLLTAMPRQAAPYPPWSGDPQTGAPAGCQASAPAVARRRAGRIATHATWAPRSQRQGPCQQGQC